MAVQIPARVLGIAGGVAAIGALALVGGLIGPALVQAAVASEPTIARSIAPVLPSPGTALDDTRLLKRNGDYFAVDAEPGYSLDATSAVTIKKIGYGETSFVTVVTTPSGTYSTDGLASTHIRYPGIHSAQLAVYPFMGYGSIFAWSKLTGWTKIPLLDARSFGYLDSDAGTASDAGVCVKDTTTGVCR